MYILTHTHIDDIPCWCSMACLAIRGNGGPMMREVFIVDTFWLLALRMNTAVSLVHFIPNVYLK